MHQDQLVSVIIPVYNSEKYLAKCIDSVLNQTYKNIEIITVNDGSTDNSLNILEDYSDQILVINQENRGLADALNSGISAMKGNWFKWFSPDDMMYSKAIEELIFSSIENGQNKIFYSNWDIINEEGKILRNFKETNYNHLNNFDFNIRLLDYQIINVNTSLIPSSLFSKGFTMNTQMNSILVDYDLFLQAGLLYNMNFHLIEKPLIKYRIHSNQLSHKNIKKSLEELESEKETILLRLDNVTKTKYLEGIKNFQKEKSISKKTLQAGLKIISHYLPNKTADKLLVFYLNKIRSTR